MHACIECNTQVQGYILRGGGHWDFLPPPPHRLQIYNPVALVVKHKIMIEVLATVAVLITSSKNNYESQVVHLLECEK